MARKFNLHLFAHLIIFITCFAPIVMVKPQDNTPKPEIDLKIVEIKHRHNESVSGAKAHNDSVKSNHVPEALGNPKIEDPKINETLEEKTVEIDSKAIYRGMLVFVTCGLIFVLYVGIKTYRRRKYDKSHTIIRKYGVRTNRSDLEMEPLPLSDDDEDETVFDLSANRQFNN
ncbi:membrane protein FAM174A-like [Anthonomus grandis grandis]|uniref:membrane protein FAM174A-like n=1 Tax=Anthonomus grandis grandis TaxID=2921223 RepID=UPI00216674C0|nr:membrane protein FAM174A-like [Anthonomus grandis grandis]